MFVAISRNDRCTNGTTDGTAEDGLVPSAQLTAQGRADGGAQARTNHGTCVIVTRSGRQGH